MTQAITADIPVVRIAASSALVVGLAALAFLQLARAVPEQPPVPGQVAIETREEAIAYANGVLYCLEHDCVVSTPCDNRVYGPLFGPDGVPADPVDASIGRTTIYGGLLTYTERARCEALRWMPVSMQGDFDPVLAERCTAVR